MCCFNDKKVKTTTKQKTLAGDGIKAGTSCTQSGCITTAPLSQLCTTQACEYNYIPKRIVINGTVVLRPYILMIIGRTFQIQTTDNFIVHISPNPSQASWFIPVQVGYKADWANIICQKSLCLKISTFKFNTLPYFQF